MKKNDENSAPNEMNMSGMPEPKVKPENKISSSKSSKKSGGCC